MIELREDQKKLIILYGKKFYKCVVTKKHGITNLVSYRELEFAKIKDDEVVVDRNIILAYNKKALLYDIAYEYKKFLKNNYTALGYTTFIKSVMRQAELVEDLKDLCEVIQNYMQDKELLKEAKDTLSKMKKKVNLDEGYFKTQCIKNIPENWPNYMFVDFSKMVPALDLEVLDFGVGHIRRYGDEHGETVEKIEKDKSGSKETRMTMFLAIEAQVRMLEDGESEES